MFLSDTSVLSTVLVGLVLLLIVGLIVFYLFRKRKKGGCAACPSGKNCPHHYSCDEKKK